jgi:hypothetical protein
MKTERKISKWIYTITLFFITLSGFGQMPIFKRYYIADIPGFGWLAKFYVTHFMHYSAAIVLIAFVTYILIDYILNKPISKLSLTGNFKIIFLSGLIITGGLMAIKNLPGVYFNHYMIIALDLTHLSFCMMLLLVSFYTLIWKKVSTD